MKKLIVIILSLLVALSLFGCKTQTVPLPVETPTASPSVEPSPSPSEEASPSLSPSPSGPPQEVVALPDVALGLEGKGFTCTGLTFDKEEDVFYIGNYGKNTPSDKAYKATIVKVSKDFTQNLGEINLFEIFPDMKAVGGVTVDKSDGSLWFCSVNENRVRHIAKDGEDLGSFKLSGALSVAYDGRTDSLWVMTGEALKNLDKEGKELRAIEMAPAGQKQLWLDEENDTVYFTAGSYNVFKLELSAELLSAAYTLKNIYSAQGLCILGRDMYVVSDGFYRSTKIPVNQVNHYDVDTAE